MTELQRAIAQLAVQLSERLQDKITLTPGQFIGLGMMWIEVVIDREMECGTFRWRQMVTPLFVLDAGSSAAEYLAWTWTEALRESANRLALEAG